MKWPSHGSNPQFLYETVNIPMPESIIDFSANINPLGPPAFIKENWNEWYPLVLDYPDPTAATLTTLLARKEGISRNQILVGNGGAELISLVGRLLSGKRVLIIQPAFSEYEEACRVNQCDIRYHMMDVESWELRLEELLKSIAEVDAVFLCNPNNPTGMFFPKQTIELLALEAEKHNTLFIVDEAFYDFVEEYESTISCLEQCEGMMILRSMTKMYSIPGLRLGYIIANEALIEKMKSQKPHWSVNALAMKVGEWCVNDEEQTTRTLKLIKEERETVMSFYREYHFSYSPSTINFYLLRDNQITDQYPFFLFLLNRGMIPRHTMNFPGLEGEWLRLAIKGPSENKRLLEVMKEWRKVGG